MDEKEKWALTYDKGGKHCGYMTSNMAEIFNSILRGVWSLLVTAIASCTFYKCNEWFMKWLVDAHMVQRHHFDYVVAPNIYLDIKRYRPTRKVCTLQEQNMVNDDFINGHYKVLIETTLLGFTSSQPQLNEEMGNL
jgi:hypothetical protein